MNIGEVLRSHREAKGLTIIDVASATRISKKYLQALEDENFLFIPSIVYAKGFLKTYAMYLGLDPKPLTEQLLSPCSQTTQNWMCSFSVAIGLVKYVLRV